MSSCMTVDLDTSIIEYLQILLTAILDLPICTRDYKLFA